MADAPWTDFAQAFFRIAVRHPRLRAVRHDVVNDVDNASPCTRWWTISGSPSHTIRLFQGLASRASRALGYPPLNLQWMFWLDYLEEHQFGESGPSRRTH